MHTGTRTNMNNIKSTTNHQQIFEIYEINNFLITTKRPYSHSKIIYNSKVRGAFFQPPEDYRLTLPTLK